VAAAVAAGCAVDHHRYPGEGRLPVAGRWIFGAGAALASVCWFTALGLGARVLSRVFARPVAWRVLDALIAVTMIALGLRLALS
jgi:arginine exporter protein ArgO